MGLDRISLSDSMKFVMKNNDLLLISILMAALMGFSTLFQAYISSRMEEILNSGIMDERIFLLFLLLIPIWLGMALLKAYVIRFTAASDRGWREDTWKIVIERLPWIVLLSITLWAIYTLIIAAAIFPIFIEPACTCLSLPLVIIVLFVVAIRLVFSQQFIVIEEVGVMDSISGSWELTSGKTLDVLILILVANLPLYLISVPIFLIPDEYYYVRLGANLFIAFFSVVATVMITRGYLELAKEEKASVDTGWLDPVESWRKPIFAVGLNDEEVRRLTTAGLTIVPVSFRAEQARVGDLIAYSSFYAGPSSWYPRKVMIFHGVGPSEMRTLMDTIYSILGYAPIFGTTNMANVNMSLSQFLSVLVREHEMRQPPMQTEGTQAAGEAKEAPAIPTEETPGPDSEKESPSETEDMQDRVQDESGNQNP